MKSFFKLAASSLVAFMVSAQGFASLNISVTGDTVIAGKVDGNSYTARGVSVNSDYQLMSEIPVALGVTGSFQNTSLGNQNEFVPTAKIWLSSNITGIPALQPYVRGGYAFSWVTPAAGSGAKNATNHGLMLNVGNNFAITETVSAIAAYSFNMRNYNNGTSQNLSTHSASLGFSAELM